MRPDTRPGAYRRSRRAGAGAALLLPVLGVSLATIPEPSAAAQDDPRLDALFEELTALDKRRDDRAGELQARIWTIWYEHQDSKVNAAMADGLDALAGERYREALAAFTRAIRRDPQFAEAWNRRGTTHYVMGNYEASLEDIERVLELEPRHFAALAGRGLCLRELGRPRAAIRALERALEINPHMDRVYLEILRLRADLRAQRE